MALIWGRTRVTKPRPAPAVVTATNDTFSLMSWMPQANTARPRMMSASLPIEADQKTKEGKKRKRAAPTAMSARWETRRRRRKKRTWAQKAHTE